MSTAPEAPNDICCCAFLLAEIWSVRRCWVWPVHPAHLADAFIGDRGFSGLFCRPEKRIHRRRRPISPYSLDQKYPFSLRVSGLRLFLGGLEQGFGLGRRISLEL